MDLSKKEIKLEVVPTSKYSGKKNVLHMREDALQKREDALQKREDEKEKVKKGSMWVCNY